MTDPVRLSPAAATTVSAGGTSVIVFNGGGQGGFIVNPLAASDQGLLTRETLFVDLAGPATLFESATTTPVQPGGTFDVPAGHTGPVWVNAASSGHEFSAILYLTPTPFPPAPQPNPEGFPPAGPTGLVNVVPSYLYEEYQDDDDLLAFVDSYNSLAQGYVDWFNTVALPIYTGLSGPLLDLVAAGVYGQIRPALASGMNLNLGPLDTYLFDEVGMNEIVVVGPANVVATNDDIFKRIITWNFYRGDGSVFDIRWLKRRVMRFLLGVNGTAPNVDSTYQVSVSFGLGNQVNITLVDSERTVLSGAFLDGFEFNSVPFDSLVTEQTLLPPLLNGVIFKEALDAGALQLPFQFEYVVTV